jgi:DNA-binding XRE family transcriptional regulator
LRFLVPSAKVEAVRRAVAPFSVEETTAVPWRAAFPEITDAMLPGVCLRGARVKEDLTQKQLAALTGIPQRHISEMENHKRPIGRQTAMKLGKALNVSHKVFL